VAVVPGISTETEAQTWACGLAERTRGIAAAGCGSQTRELRLVNQFATKDAASWLGPLIADELVSHADPYPNARQTMARLTSSRRDLN
jgi:hypothetical protein